MNSDFTSDFLDEFRQEVKILEAALTNVAKTATPSEHPILLQALSAIANSLETLDSTFNRSNFLSTITKEPK